MVATRDLKSLDRKIVRVRVPPRAQNSKTQNISSVFLNFVPEESAERTFEAGLENLLSIF
jgi:hypothetical protein